MASTNTANLAAATRNLVVEQGSSVTFNFEPSRDGNPIDLTDFILNMQVRRSFADRKVLINCTLANNKLVYTNRPLGKFRLSLEPIDTSELNFTADELEAGQIEAVYDLEISNPITGETLKGVKGKFTILREVTRV